MHWQAADHRPANRPALAAGRSGRLRQWPAAPPVLPEIPGTRAPPGADGAWGQARKTAPSAGNPPPGPPSLWAKGQNRSCPSGSGPAPSAPMVPRTPPGPRDRAPRRHPARPACHEARSRSKPDPAALPRRCETRCHPSAHAPQAAYPARPALASSGSGLTGRAQGPPWATTAAGSAGTRWRPKPPTPGSARQGQADRLRPKPDRPHPDAGPRQPTPASWVQRRTGPRRVRSVLRSAQNPRLLPP